MVVNQSAAYLSRAWAAGVGGVVAYPGMPPTPESLRADLPRIGQLLEVRRLRFYTPLSELRAQSARLAALAAVVRHGGYEPELVLTDLDAYTVGKPASAAEALPALPRGFRLMGLEAALTPAGRARFIRLYTTLDRVSPERAIAFRRPAELVWLSQMVPAPERWLYHYAAPLHRLHAHVRRIDGLLGESSWELAQTAVPARGDEYDQAWLLRFAFYFSKKYGLLPAAVSLRDSRTARGELPGLLRPDGSLKPSFWLAQVYYHVRRIDLDEPKLTAALYEQPPPEPAMPAEREAFLRQFLGALYKLRESDPVLPYLSSRQSDLFYDFLQLRSEESLLNSHFGRLEEIGLTPTGDGSWLARLAFVSALGTFRFSQPLGLAPRGASWRVSALGEPGLLPDYERAELGSPIAIALTQEIPTSLTADTRVYRQRDGLLLRYTLRNRSQDPVDLQPISLTGASDGNIYMPAPVEAVLQRQLAPGERFTGTIRFPATQQAWRLRISAVPSERYAPRALQAEARIRGDQLELLVTNPLVERLLLPVMQVQLEDTGTLYQLRYVLPQALLPLERKRYSLPLPGGLDRARTRIAALAGSYPIVDLEINLDDAWRSKRLAHWPQALYKYREILRRFGPNLAPLRQAQVLHELVWLEMRLDQPEAALKSLAALEALKGVPRQTLGQIHYELAELLLEYGRFGDALRLAARGRALLPGHLPLLRLQAYLNLRLGRLPEAIAGYRALLLRFPDDVSALETLSGLYQRQSRWAEALVPLLRLHTLAPRTSRLRTIASLYQRLGQLRPALSWYLRYAAQSSDFRTRLKIAWLYRRLQQPANALDWSRRALAAGAPARTWLDVAGLERELGRPAAALAAYRRLFEGCSDCSSRIWADAAYLAKQTGERALAERYYARHLQLTNDPASRRTLAFLYQQRGQRAQALTTLRPLATSCRGCAPLLRELAWLARSQGRWNEAMGYYRRIGPLSALPRATRYDLAFGALRAGDADLATSLVTGLLPAASPSQELALRRELAGLYRRRGQPARALPLLEAGYARLRRPALLRDLIATALEANQPERLRTLLAQPSSLSALGPDGDDLLGRWAYTQQDYVTATERLKRAILASPRLNGEQYRLLAAAYRALGQSDCAIAWLEHAEQRIAGTRPEPLPEACD